MQLAVGKIVEAALLPQGNARLRQHVTTHHAFKVNAERRRFAQRAQSARDGMAVALRHFALSGG